MTENDDHRDSTKRITSSPFDPLVKTLFPPLARKVPIRITPNMVTIAGVVAAGLAGLALVLCRFAPSLFLVAAALVFVNWITDTLDGVLARQRGQCSKLGDFLDHVFDAITAAIVTTGCAFSGFAHPELTLLMGVVFLVSFAVTYKGEQVTGVYELLTFGPTEVRFALIVVLTLAYAFPAPLLSLFDYDLRVLDITALLSLLWAFVYAWSITLKYIRMIERADRAPRSPS